MDSVAGLLILLIGIILAGAGFLLRLKFINPERPEEPLKPAETATPHTDASIQPLFATKENFFSSLKKLIFSTSQLDKILPDIEDTLLMADVGLETTQELMMALQEQKEITTPEAAYEFLKSTLTRWLTPSTAFSLRHKNASGPLVMYLVGVNGVGKTTTIGKLACQFKSEGYRVMLVAADTFRAAAVEQLRIWAERNQVEFAGGKSGADPSSVIVDGLRTAKSRDADIVLVDTAGRLHTKSNLMDELKKMSRMCEKECGRPPDEIFIVLDAVTGQNGLLQADVFFKAVPVSGIILTKYDSTAKGGILIAVVRRTGLPIRYLGLGEKIEDLKKFDAVDFVAKIF